MMQRLKIDDALPLEMGLVSRLIEQSQTRVEGANFDVRKHLLEYDDVLNAQRARIYAERNRVFSKPDLTEDVTSMLRIELTSRVPEALKDEAGPWKLLAWLEQVQPSFLSKERYFPSLTLKFLVDEILETLPEKPGVRDVREKILAIAKSSLEAEAEHHMQAVEALIEQGLIKMEEQIRERNESLDIYFEGLEIGEEFWRNKETCRAGRRIIEYCQSTAQAFKRPAASTRHVHHVRYHQPSENR